MSISLLLPFYQSTFGGIFAQLSKEVAQPDKLLKVLGFVFKDENHFENFLLQNFFEREF